MTVTPYTPSGAMTHAVSPSMTTETKTSIHNSCTLFFICVTIIIINYQLSMHVNDTFMYARVSEIRTLSSESLLNTQFTLAIPVKKKKKF